MLTTNAFAAIGALVGDPARASMLVALMDGRALTATELAVVAGVTPQTASGHLARLVAGELLAVERQGRRRYHRMATPAIAQMIEGMMAVAVTGSTMRRVAPRTGPTDVAMRQARTCYDHLAGRLAVGIADQMIERGEIRFGVDGGELTGLGGRLLDDLGIDIPQAAGWRGRGAFCRPCRDWSERRPHIAGVVGRALLNHSIDSAVAIRRGPPCCL
ncbi:ArsR/SmtB family transcription factor [Sphingomonas sp. PAMC 26605]|uniref:ArsR/SmtB family transcription factor n=1 Tax=Sphingomonas sp. PAMC 26605 TaxID=1112214 RepID=UPI00026CCBBD|nr:MarR family transcriptional regulator [Sphingomonas sp. PAMC 26605]